MIPLNRNFTIQSASKILCTVYKSEKLDPLQPFSRWDIPSRRPTVQSIIRLDDKNFPSRPSSVSKSFELLQLASVRTFQQHVRTTLSVRPATGFLSKIQIWEDRCNRPDDVDSCPDALIHKESIAFKIKTSGRQFSWSGRVSIRYGNCVHQINRSDDHSLGPDAWSLGMEITCSGSTTIRTTRQQRPNAAQIRKEFLQNFGKPIAQLSVRTSYDYRPDGA